MKILRTFLFLSICLLSATGGFVCDAQDIKEVSGTITEKTNHRALKNVRVYAFNTVAEAQDAYNSIKKAIEEQGFIYPEGAIEVQSNEEGYFSVHVAMSGALVFLDETSSSSLQLQKVEGRMEINVSLLVGEVLDEAKVTALGGEEPVFEAPEFDGKTITCGVKFPLKARMGKENARLVFQTYMMQAGVNDTVLFREPIVKDGAQYHQTQLRRMGYDPHNDPLFLLAEKQEVLDEGKASISWRDTVDLPDPSKVYFYNCRMWLEDYNNVYHVEKDTTIFRSDRVRQPMKYLEYSLDTYSLDPEKYKKTPRREKVSTPGKINITFPVGKTSVDPADSVSVGELERLRKELFDVSHGDGTTLKELHILGTASPEGSYTKNLSLANQRMQYILNQVTSYLSKDIIDRTYTTRKAEVAGWDKVADLLYSDSLKTEAEQIREIVGKFPSIDNQGSRIRNLSFYKDKIVPALPRLRSVDYTSVVEIYRELTPEEIYEKYLADKKYKFALYEYWALFKMVKDEDELMQLYKDAYEASSRTAELWALPANNLAELYLKKGIVDTTVLAPFINLKFKLNQKFYTDGRLDGEVNQEEIVANQLMMLLNAKEFMRAGQLSMLLDKADDPEKYRTLKLFTMCLAGYWRKDPELRQQIMNTSPHNAVVMLLASEKFNQAFEALDKLDMERPVSMYLKVQVMCRKYGSYSAMYDDFDDETFLAASDIAEETLAECFRRDSSFIEAARADYDIYEKVLENALKLYEESSKAPVE